MEPHPDLRTQRLAENEVVFRDINERLERDLRTLVAVPDDERFPFVCECSRRDCQATIDLTFAEYEHVREDPMRFAVVEGHEEPEIETVYERHEHYAVVRKHEDTRPVIEQTDHRYH